MDPADLRLFLSSMIVFQIFQMFQLFSTFLGTNLFRFLDSTTVLFYIWKLWSCIIFGGTSYTGVETIGRKKPKANFILSLHCLQGACQLSRHYVWRIQAFSLTSFGFFTSSYNIPKVQGTMLVLFLPIFDFVKNF